MPGGLGEREYSVSELSESAGDGGRKVVPDVTGEGGPGILGPAGSGSGWVSVPRFGIVAEEKKCGRCGG